MGTTQTILTFAEFERLPDQPGKQELLRGELIQLPPAKKRHDYIALRIYRQLDTALQAAHARGEAVELGDALHEFGFQLGGNTWLRPDVSIAFAGQGGDDYFQGSPAIAVEVVSPSNTVEAMDSKTDLYFEFGAREVWRVYPKTRKVLVHLSATESVTHHDSVSTPLIPGLSMSIDGILDGV